VTRGTFAVAQSDAGNPDTGGDRGVVLPVCDPTAKYQSGTLIPVSTPQSDLFGAVTPDELTIAWMATAGSVLYADRAKATDPFV